MVYDAGTRYILRRLPLQNEPSRACADVALCAAMAGGPAAPSCPSVIAVDRVPGAGGAFRLVRRGGDRHRSLPDRVSSKRRCRSPAIHQRTQPHARLSVRVRGGVHPSNPSFVLRIIGVPSVPCRVSSSWPAMGVIFASTVGTQVKVFRRPTIRIRFGSRATNVGDQWRTAIRAVNVHPDQRNVIQRNRPPRLPMTGLERGRGERQHLQANDDCAGGQQRC